MMKLIMMIKTFIDNGYIENVKLPLHGVGDEM